MPDAFCGPKPKGQSRHEHKNPMKRNLASFALFGLLASGWAATTINSTNPYAFGANVGWFNAGGDVTHGAVIGEYVCSGCLWAANVGWIHLGDGTPANSI